MTRRRRRRSASHLGRGLAQGYVQALRRVWRTVGRLMRPRRRPDLFVEKLQAWRSWLGYASVVVAVGLYGSAPDDLGQQLLEGAVIGFVVKAVVAVPIVVVAIVIIAIVSHPTQRLARIEPALRTLGLLGAAIGLPWFAVTIVERLDGSATRPDFPLLGLAVLVGVVLAIPLLFVGAASAVVHGVRYLFCVGDVHPLLPSVLAFLIALCSGAENVSGALDPGPGVELALAWLAVGGSLVVLGLTVFEHCRLRQHGSR
ncbi:hypothetical protein [Kineococcus sp. R86509]|uniref:hypothetical protein n=1 Tax=Kineococcus sp. R86509 TaxID=3093851 RepID=UPI0036D39F17